jgi:hypothetical protein
VVVPSPVSLIRYVFITIYTSGLQPLKKLSPAWVSNQHTALHSDHTKLRVDLTRIREDSTRMRAGSTRPPQDFGP